MEMSGYGYNCSAGETFDSIALSIYGDEKYAADLICANPEFCQRSVFAGGELLLVPVVIVPENTETALPATAPWKVG